MKTTYPSEKSPKYTARDMLPLLVLGVEYTLILHKIQCNEDKCEICLNLMLCQKGYILEFSSSWEKSLDNLGLPEEVKNNALGVLRFCRDSFVNPEYALSCKPQLEDIYSCYNSAEFIQTLEAICLRKHN